METIYLLLGSNLGDRYRNLDLARQQISRQIGTLVTQSSVYKTAAWGKTNQPAFYNQVVAVKTVLSPRKALEILQSIEEALGRTRAEKWGPRIMDIDILFWGDQIVNEPNLTIPHPGIPQRRFTLMPLVEIRKDFIHPILRRDMKALLEECTDSLSVEKLFPKGS
jgi:2-amino-4-hydroxy-6-hydroxymethyldihydropteridine diphosphokinase